MQAIDLDQLQGMSFALKPLRYASPAALAEELTSIFGSEEGHRRMSASCLSIG